MNIKTGFSIMLICVCLVCSSCTKRFSYVQQADDFELELMMNDLWAIGGVVWESADEMDRGAAAEFQNLPQDWQGPSQIYSPYLVNTFLEKEPQLNIWAFPVVKDQVVESSLKFLHNAYAGGDSLQYDCFEPIAEALPKVRYLVLAGLENTKIETRQDHLSSAADQEARDGRDTHANVMSRTLIVHRTIFMTLTVFDLKDGRELWSSRVELWAKEPYFLSKDYAQVDVVSEGPEGAPVPVGIELEGTPLRGPDVGDEIKKACRALVLKLMDERGKMRWEDGDSSQ